MSEDVPAILSGFGPGSVLAGYRLETQVGAGGMAVVFRARDERLGRPVALKILAPGLAADPAFRRRFIAESRAAATVDDPHIIPVYEAGEAGGVLFIAMRFVAGGDLRLVLHQEGPLPPDRAAEFLSPVASALDAAHRAGLVHRDVKPANILVDASADRPDHVYLSDFGVSKGAMSSTGATGTGHFLGTPGYSAPEQIRGRAVDGRADQYALACVAYELLTGAAPFERDHGMAVLLAHLSEPPPPLGAGLPGAADQVLARAMAKAPEQRYASCRDFADALRDALGVAPYRSRGPGPPPPPVAAALPGWSETAEARTATAADPADLTAPATIDSPPGDGPVRADDVPAIPAPVTEPARADAYQPTSAASVPTPDQGARYGREAGKPGRRPRRLLLVIALGCVTLAVAGTVPFLLTSSSGPGAGHSNQSGSGSSSGSGGGSGAPLTASAPGITPTTITIGSHQPLTGPAAPGYDEIAPASAAYFAYVNAHGGVYGRKIVYKVLDDSYDPTRTATVVRRLVLQDNVYGIFNGLGTPTHLNAVSFLNSEKVPDVFVASGCECWDQPSVYPDTFGYQLDYVREGKILGQYVAQHFKGEKVGYFYEDDEFGQDGVRGLSYEIPSSMVVGMQSYAATNVNIAPQVAALHASGAQVVVSFSVPAFTALLKLSCLKLGYTPALVVSNVGADPITLAGLLEAFAGQGGTTVNGNALTSGIITDGYAPSLGDTGNSWIALFRKIHDQYDAQAPFDGNVLYGEAVAYEFVQAMLKAGRNPTRADLVAAIDGGLPQGPTVAPCAYSPSDHDGATGAYIGVIRNGVVVQVGPVLTTDTSASGPIAALTGAEPQAPASGIPSP